MLQMIREQIDEWTKTIDALICDCPCDVEGGCHQCRELEIVAVKMRMVKVFTQRFYEKDGHAPSADATVEP